MYEISEHLICVKHVHLPHQLPNDKRIWNYEEGTLLNSFDNYSFPDKGISKLCLLNDLDESLLLVVSSDGNICIWKDYALRCHQKFVTTFSSNHGHRPSARNVNVVVDWKH